MSRATTVAIVALLLFTVAIPAQTTTLTVADASEGNTTNFEPALNSQPVVNCPFFESFDQVTPPLLPSGWTAINAINPDGILWQTSDSGLPSPPYNNPPNAAWINDPDTISDKYLDSPPITIPSQVTNVFLSVSNNYALEDGFDGGVLEVGVDGGPFQDILAAGGFFDQNGYNGTISACCGNPLAGRQAWTGNSGGFIAPTFVDLTVFRGHSIVLRWRMASDSSGSSEGWRVDNIAIDCFINVTPPPTPTVTATPTPTPTATPRPAPTPRVRPTPPPRPTPP
jgi:hypothetical protein